MGGSWLAPVIIGVALSLIGFGLLWVAEELEPGPLVGFRISYVTVSRRVWRRVNRLFGLIAGFGSLIVIPLGIFWGLGVQLTSYTAIIVFGIVFTVEYSRVLAERELIRESGELGEAELIEPLGLVYRVALVSILILDIILYVYASIIISREGLLDLIPVSAIILVPGLYLTYLSLARIEAFALPWIGGRYKVFAFLTTLSVLVVDASLALILIRMVIYGLLLIILSLIILIYPIVVSLQGYRLRVKYSNNK